ncbi:MAG TPA: STAS domain-containing protein [Candidatus Polarisedimenticolia bacterium]|nr:STAS domain-containing protein [Candidatus Polarisedimenticolia bacterium]
MSIQVRARDGVRILELTGDFTVGRHLAKPRDLQGRPLDDLRKTIDEMLEKGDFRIVLDLAPMKFIDSAGLGELIACRKAAVQRGGDIKILHPAGKVKELLVLTLLTDVFEIFQDEEEAVRSFGRATG